MGNFGKRTTLRSGVLEVLPFRERGTRETGEGGERKGAGSGHLHVCLSPPLDAAYGELFLL